MTLVDEEVDVHNNQLGAWLDEMRFKERSGQVSLRFVVGEGGVTAIETTDLATKKRTVTRVLSLESSVHMALTVAPPEVRVKR